MEMNYNLPFYSDFFKFLEPFRTCHATAEITNNPRRPRFNNKSEQKLFENALILNLATF